MERKLCVAVTSPSKIIPEWWNCHTLWLFAAASTPAATRRQNKLWKGGRFDDYVQLKTSTLERGVNDSRCISTEYSKLEFTFTAADEFEDNLPWTWAALPITYSIWVTQDARHATTTELLLKILLMVLSSAIILFNTFTSPLFGGAGILIRYHRGWQSLRLSIIN